MDPWTLFWIVVLLIVVWTFRHFIAIVILAAAAFVFGALGLASFSAYEKYEEICERRHKRKYKL